MKLAGLHSPKSGLLLLVLAAIPALGPEVLAAERLVSAHWTTEPLVLDGELNEPAWELSEPTSGFIQSEPRQGEPSTERTEVRILFSQDHLYFGVTCFDSLPEAIVAKSLRRDFSPDDEDSFEILLDTFSSARDGFLFVTNPNGAKRDVQVTNEGRENNDSWDTVWEVSTKITAIGWVAEIRIPMKSLRYDRDFEDSWKINFGRRIRRHNETAYWSQVPRRYDITQVSLAGRLVGLGEHEIRPGRNMSLTPYVTGNLTDHDGDLDTDLEVGADFKYALTAGLTLDLTYNTDFSHVEVDQEQVNLDRFRLTFPEKRDFFLDNLGIFEIGSVRLQRGRPDAEDPAVFYSRNVGLSLEGRPVPILGGARLTGRAGAYELGLLSIETGEAEGQGRENDSVLRVKRDVLARSWVGGFFLSRQGPERPANRVFGMDGLYRPHDNVLVNSFFAKSQTSDAGGKNWATRVEALYNPRWIQVIGTHAIVQEDYRDDLGFTSRTGISAQRVEIRPRIRPWENRILREIQPVVNIRYISDPEGRLVTRKQSLGFDFFFQNGAFIRFRRRNYFERLDEPFNIAGHVVIPAADYHYDEQGIELRSDRSRALSGSFSWYKGDFWTGEKKTVEAGVQYRPNRNLAAELDFSRDVVRLSEGEFTVDLVGLRLRYAFNTRTFLDTFIQYNSEDRQVISNVRFNLIHHPLSDFFIVFTEERITGGSEPTDRILSLKYTHLLNF